MNKIIIALLLAIPITSNAEVKAWIPNKDGGKIILTDLICDTKIKKASEVSYLTYSSSSNQPQPISGCYQVDFKTEQILIRWDDDGKIYIYEAGDLIYPKK